MVSKILKTLRSRPITSVCCFVFILLTGINSSYANGAKPSISFVVSVKDVSAHLFHIICRIENISKETIEFKLPAWTPGYYQLMNYATNASDFKVTNGSNDSLKWQKTSDNSWRVETKNAASVILSYDIKAAIPFVAANYLDKDRGYISPAGVFMHPEGLLNMPVTIKVEPYPDWNKIATGLDTIKGKQNTYFATNYDVLYDSPILMGMLETFPSFTVKNIPHHFIAFKAGDFDRKLFMGDIKKIVETASDIIGDIPYKQYSFLAIGPGGGGIEHLNSTSISFDGKGLDSKEGRIRTYNFLAHEYFHYYNVKRIRPIELGPFDYDKGSVTKMLWLSEGITVYYEYIILKRAGFTTSDELLEIFRESIEEYENKPGRYFQTPAEASYNTWSDGPFGRTGDEVNKTISPYDKGPALGLLLDFKIRHETKNKKSLDDLMRLLYNKYYKQKGRGFTEDEFRGECEKIAGTSLADFFDYIYTLKQVDYPTYLGYAGLAIDTVAHELPGGWLGITARDKNDSLFVSNAEWQSPAWNAGLRNRNVILLVNGNKMDAKSFNQAIATSKEGDKIKILYAVGSKQQEAEIEIGQKWKSNYSITRINNPDALQSAIFTSWLEGDKK